MLNIDNFMILRNKRISSNTFSMDHSCDYCDLFVSSVIIIPFSIIKQPQNKMNNGFIKVCKGCLTKMIKHLDENMVQSFESDFQERRATNA